jgi:hypothetical protein
MKLDGSAAIRREIELPDFDLREEVLCLMFHIDRLVTATIEILDVQAGIPRRVVFIPSSHQWATLLRSDAGRL